MKGGRNPETGERPSQRRGARLLSATSWGVFGLWLVVQLPVFADLVMRGITPIDFLTYRRAADALARGNSPYATPQEGERICREFHRTEVEMREAALVGQGQAVLRGIGERPQQPGLYIYAPTLALLVWQLRVSPLAFAGLLLLAILGFARMWLASAGAGGLWLLLVVGSWEVLASWYGGNVELVLLCAALLAARLLWTGRPAPVALAAPLIALTLLVKPPYALLFVAFGLLQLASLPGERRATLRRLALAAALAVGVAALEVARWGPALRAQTLRYVLSAADYMCFRLPSAEQTPLSLWNRTPLQALVSAGVPYDAAQPVALALWLLFLAVTLWRVRGAPLGFPLAFALALVLFYWGRPVGWILAYLEVVLLVTLWPVLQGWQRPALLGAALALMASRWWALALTLWGQGLPLLTLQPAHPAWETWLVLPASWVLLLRAVPPADGGATRRGPDPPEPPSAADNLLPHVS